jgi:AraC-like DNA-binding protein
MVAKLRCGESERSMQFIVVEDIGKIVAGIFADRANMSPSSFHYHFKQVTLMSPLNYQKQLRLLEARRLMLVEQSTAANAADLVGYESSSQFSREYARMFGAPPIQDIDRLRILSSTNY